MKEFKLFCYLDKMLYNGIIHYNITASYYDGLSVTLVDLEHGNYLVQGKETKKSIASYLLTKCYNSNRNQLPHIKSDSCFYTDSLGRYHHC